MKYIKKYENFKPITINSAKPFKVKKNIDNSLQHLQKGITSLRKRIDKPKRKRDVNASTKMNNDKNAKIKQLKDLQFKKLKQQEYLRNNPIKENLDNSENLISILSSPDFKPEDIENLIGLEEKEYEIKIDSEYNNQTHKYEYNYSKDGVRILMKSETLEDLMDIENGVLQYFMQFTSGYNDYEHYVDDDELNYLHRYLPDELIEKIKKLSKLFKTGIEIEESEYNEYPAIPELFEYLGLNDKLEDFKSEIRMENERALEKSACAELEKLPFKLNYEFTGNFDLDLYFDYDDLIEYMKEHNINAKNIKEVLENIDNANEFTWENEYERISEFLGDFENLKRSVETVVDDCIEFPDDIYPKVIAVDNLEAFKNNLELADFKSVYPIWIKYDNIRLNLFEIAKRYNNTITEWLSSKEFEKFIMTQSTEEIDNYQEFIMGENIKKYNL